MKYSKIVWNSIMFLLVLTLAGASGIHTSHSNLNIACEDLADYTIQTTVWNLDDISYEGVVMTSLNPDDEVFELSPLSEDLGTIDAGASDIKVAFSISALECVPGTYEFVADFTDESSVPISLEENTVFATITLKENPLLVTVVSPVNRLYETPPNFEVETTIESECEHTLDGETIATTGLSKNHVVAVSSIESGQHEYDVYCYTGTQERSKTVRFETDNSGPQIISSSPEGLVTDTFTRISVTTDEKAECRIASSMLDFSQMDVLTTYDGLEHRLDFPQIQDGGYTYYILCEDIRGYMMDEHYVLHINVEAPPVATIEIEGVKEEEILKKGRYDVTLRSTKDLVSPPSLTLTIEDDTTEIKMYMEGSRRVWTGEFVIDDEGYDNSIARFEFVGQDSRGELGGRIASGETFIVDTLAPRKVTGALSYQEDDKIIVEWKESPEDDSESYIVYRAPTTTFSTYTDKFETSSTRYYDDKIEVGRQYFYFITAVDKNDNEGEPSEYTRVQVKDFGSEEAEEELFEEEESLLAPEESEKIEESLTKYRKLSEDIGIYIDTMRTYDDERAELVRSKGILSQTTNAKKKVDEFIAEIEKLQKNPGARLIARLGEIDKEIEKLHKDIIKEVVIESKKEYENYVTTESVSLGLNDYYDMLRSESPDIQKEIKNVLKLNQDNPMKRVGVVLYTTSYNDGKNYYTMIQEISELPSVVVMTRFEATVLNDLNKVYSNNILGKLGPRGFIVFDTNKPLMIISEKIDMSRLEEVQSIIMVNTLDGSSEFGESDGFTGKVIAPVEGFMKRNGIIFGVVIIVALLIYYFFTPEEMMKAIQKRSKEAKPKGDMKGKSQAASATNDKDEKKIEEELLRKASAPLVTKDGKRIENLFELAAHLPEMDEKAFRQHIEKRNDFALWIAKSLDNPELAARIKDRKTREEIGLEIINYFIK